MATTQTAPNQIQLEVEVNQENAPEPEQEPPVTSDEEVQEEPDDEEEDEEESDDCLKYVSLVVILIIFIWPFCLTLLNYWSDWNLWLFIRETHSDYNDVRSSIQSSSTNISILTCSFNGDNSLSDFESFLVNSTDSTKCECNYINSASSNWDCATLSDADWTTSNIDYEQCIAYETEPDSTCLVCNGCKASSVYAKNSAYYLYSVQLYDDIKDIKVEREKYCSPKKTRDNVNSNVIDSYFTHCSNACIAFFVISGVWLLCGLCTGCKVRWRDLYRSYLWCCKGKKPKKRSKYHPDHSINRDEFTLYIVAILFLHIFEDVVQCIIAIMFSIYKQSNGGSECIEALNSLTYADSVELIPYKGGTGIAEIMTHDDTVRIFYLFAFMHVFFSGLYGVRLLNFDLQNIMTYAWYQNCGYLIAGIFMGLLFMLLVLGPFWGAVWMSADFLYLTKGEAAFLMWTFVAGLCGYVVSICMPLCFADQLDCGCDCDAGCCG